MASQSGDQIYCLEDYHIDEESCTTFLSEFEGDFAKQLRSRSFLEIETCLDDWVKRLTAQHLCVNPAAFTQSCERCVCGFLDDQQLFAARGDYRSWEVLKQALLEILRPHCLSNEDRIRTC